MIGVSLGYTTSLAHSVALGSYVKAILNNLLIRSVVL